MLRDLQGQCTQEVQTCSNGLQPLSQPDFLGKIMGWINDGLDDCFHTDKVDSL